MIEYVILGLKILDKIVFFDKLFVFRFQFENNIVMIN